MTTTVRTQLTTAQVCQMFGISNMTLYSWRKGSATRTPLPEATPRGKSAKPVLRFNPAQVLTWAKKNDVAVIKAPYEVLSAGNPGKPGPKPRTKAA